MSAIRLILLTLSLSVCTTALAQNTWRWVDKNTGQTVYSDHPPPAGAKNVSVMTGKVGGPGSSLSYATRLAAEKFPVVLYTSKTCDEYCAKARDLLNTRGIPFNENTIDTREEADAISAKLGGKLLVPAMTVGAQKHLGFQETAWNQLLDLAGYPKSGK